MCVCVFVCVCMYGYTHTHTHTHMYTCTCTHTHTHMHACIQTHTHTHTHTLTGLLSPLLANNVLANKNYNHSSWLLLPETRARAHTHTHTHTHTPGFTSLRRLQTQKVHWQKKKKMCGLLSLFSQKKEKCQGSHLGFARK